MSRLRHAPWLGVALVALPLPAAAQNVCGAIERLAAAAREQSPFASTRIALAGGQEVVPGFRPGECSVQDGALSCDVTDFGLDHFHDWPDPLPCRGLVALPLPASARPLHRDWRRGYALSGVSIGYGLTCSGCAGGGRSFFRVTLAGRRPKD